AAGRRLGAWGNDRPANKAASPPSLDLQDLLPRRGAWPDETTRTSPSSPARLRNPIPQFYCGRHVFEGKLETLYFTVQGLDEAYPECPVCGLRAQGRGPDLPGLPG